MNALFRLLRLLFFFALAALMMGLVIKEKPRVLTDPLAALALELVKPAADSLSGTATLVVAEGASGTEIASQLAQEGLIRNPALFRVLLAYYDIDRNLKAGRYTFPAGTELSAILKALGTGTSDELVTVTIPEGWRVEQVADLLQSKGVARREDVLRLVMGDSLGLSGNLLGTPSPSLEGYLFPDTYLVPKSYGAQPFVVLMVQTFKERVDARYAEAVRQAVGSGQGGRLLSKYEVVTLASIVEREARLPEERGLIAGVFLRRLSLGMPLAADPTVQYALVAQGSAEPPDGYWKRELAQLNLRVASSYNTYVVQGLPPTPICNPGLAALDAVLHPEPTEALYFVAKPDGSHAFAATFDEHQANVVRYQR